MPILVLKPNLEVVITKQQENRILQLLETDQEIIKVNETTFHRSAFAYIKPGGYTQADLPKNNPNMRLASDNRPQDEQYKAARRASQIARSMLQKRGLAK